MTIQEQLNEIKTEKENIKTVLINKGIHLTGISFTEYHNILKDYNFQIPIETTLTSTVNNTSIHYGATVTISGTISATDSTILSGQTVTLYNDTTSVGTATIDSTGAYSLTYTVQTMTSPNLTVKYAGKGLYTASTSEVPVLTISKADTVITLTSNKTSASTGETVTLTATLVDINGNPVNGATVNFMEGTSTLYSGITTNGVISYNYSSSSGGTKSLQCSFNGDINYNASNSNIINVNITNTISLDSWINNTAFTTCWGNSVSKPASGQAQANNVSAVTSATEFTTSTKYKLELTYETDARGGRNAFLFGVPTNTTNIDEGYKILTDIRETQLEGKGGNLGNFGSDLLTKGMHTITLLRNNGTMTATLDGVSRTISYSGYNTLGLWKWDSGYCKIYNLKLTLL